MRIDLDAIQKRRACITPSPWEVIEDSRPDVVQKEIWSVSRRGGYENEGQIIRAVHKRFGHIAEFSKNWGDGNGMGSASDDADFIAHAPADVDALLEEVEQLKKELEFYRQPSAKGGLYFVSGKVVGRMMDLLYPFSKSDDEADQTLQRIIDRLALK